LSSARRERCTAAAGSGRSGLLEPQFRRSVPPSGWAGNPSDRSDPADEVRELSDQVLSRTDPTPYPESLHGVSGDLIVAVSEGDFISFDMRWPNLDRALVAIKSDWLRPLSCPTWPAT
jgi:hypothetical protein